MHEPDTEVREPALARWIATSLRVGTLSAVLLIGIGYAWTTFVGAPPQGERAITREISDGGGDAVVAIGLLVLTLLPIVVLVVAGVAFARSGESRMVATTALVTVLLVASLVAAAVIGPVI